jgi:hypothetical protein
MNVVTHAEVTEPRGMTLADLGITPLWIVIAGLVSWWITGRVGVGRDSVHEHKFVSQ